MKCVSCESIIDPKWKSAIELNHCPFCGKNILDEELKTLLTDLNNSFDSILAFSYDSELNDWLFSNHQFVKVTDPNILSLIPKDILDDYAKSLKLVPHTQDNKENIKLEKDEVIIKKIQSDKVTSEFAKRALVPTKGFSSVEEKTQHLKAMAQKIKQEGIGSGESVLMEDNESMEPVSKEEITQLKKLISGNDDSSESDGFSDIDEDDDDEIPAGILAAANMSKTSDQMSAAADIAKLQKLHSKISDSKKNFKSGGGGFSR